MKRSIILTKREVTFGDEGLTMDQSNALQVSDFNMARWEGELKERNFDHNGIGNQKSINTDEHTMTTFGLEAAPSDVAGTEVAYGHVIEACSFDKVIDPGVSVTYTVPVDGAGLRTGRASMATEEYDPETGMLQRSYGQIGSLSFDGTAKDYVKFAVSGMRGSYLEPAPGTPPAILPATWDAFKEPISFIKNHIKTATVDGFTVCPISFKYNWNLNIADLGTCNTLFYSDYKPTLELTIVAPNINDKNLWALNGQIIAIDMGVADKDDTAGKRIKIFSPTVQLLSIDDKGEQDGLRTLVLNCNPIGQPASIVMD